ncbi:copper homeostasis membrane protein CopD [Altererythrobacter xixiisoli]|uniref:Copper homeostasis membrane protein CopD n=1 Tax=Croceibacterium xixiisoli TaxID=1476466 RepID=A0A6I4TZF4_9SPHN|nr:copper homeostasis membrane protein CopD [Croceibacterium xixiisoli]MXO99743.1 copper homeostasis membrane protein CopD [Croceibacterium xixiisoli]
MENLPVIAIRFALYAVLMVLAGLPAFSLYALPQRERSGAVLPLTGIAVTLALLGLLLSALGMIALVAAMMGTGLWPVDWEMLGGVVQQSAIGTAWIVRMAALTVALLAALALRRFPLPARIMLVASAGVAIVTLVWTGHAGASEGMIGTIHQVSDAVHMLAAAVWIGALVGFCLLLQPGRASQPQRVAIAARALEQFARIGTIAVLLIVATGLINGIILLGLPSLVALVALVASFYGQLLLVKLALFAAMLGLAGANRWRFTPGLRAGHAPDSALGHLRRSLALETGAALAILGVVAWLGTLDPGA